MATLFNNVANTNTVNYVPVQATFDASGNFLTFIGPGGVPFNTTSGGLTINTSKITGGTTGSVLYDNAGVVGELTTTGTGSVVLSDSPTLTGNVSANVNLRSDTLANLLPLAGGTSEIGYATDVDALVRFNGTAGQAQVLGAYGNGGTLNFTLNASNITDLTNPTSGVYIDCNNVSYLFVKIDPAIAGTTNAYTNLNIKLPNSATIPSFKVNISNNSYAFFWNQTQVTITLAYQAADIAAGLSYFPIAADLPTSATGPWSPTFRFTNYTGIEINFIVQVLLGSLYPTWGRLPLASEGGYNFNTLQGGAIGATINQTGSAQTLTSGAVATCGAMTLTSGLWLITGYVTFNVTSAVIATEIMAGINNPTTTSVPNNTSTTSMVRITQNLPTAGIITLGFAPVVFGVGPGTSVRYGNARATFTAGVIIANITQRAIRIG